MILFLGSDGGFDWVLGSGEEHVLDLKWRSEE